MSVSVEKIDVVKSFSHYASLASRTNADFGYKLNLSHMVMGMMSEISEYYEACRSGDLVNQKEELCDILWYVANYCNIRGIDADSVYKFDKDVYLHIEDCRMLRVVSHISDCISEFSDIIKKYVAYEKPVEASVEQFLLRKVINSVVANFHDEKDLFKSLANNINKLIVRFPDKFTADNAINRKLDQEREELER